MNLKIATFVPIAFLLFASCDNKSGVVGFNEKDTVIESKRFFCGKTTASGAWRLPPNELEIVETELLYTFKAAAASRAARIPAYREDNLRLANYWVRYKESKVEGKPTIEISGFCESPEHKCSVQVFDGGPCYFSGVFDRESKKIESFHFNGHA